MEIVKVIITIIGSSAFFAFIQFLITRHDNKKSKINELCEKLDKGLENQAQATEEQYETLHDEIKTGLLAQQKWGFEHYGEHKESIMKLQEAILQLTKNDTEQSQYMKTIGESLIGLSHDKIMALSDKFLERGAITLKEKATIKSIYEPYQKLGGNGDCHVAYSYICNLPIISDDKAKELDKGRE